MVQNLFRGGGLAPCVAILAMCVVAFGVEPCQGKVYHGEGMISGELDAGGPSSVYDLAYADPMIVELEIGEINNDPHPPTVTYTISMRTRGMASWNRYLIGETGQSHVRLETDGVALPVGGVGGGGVGALYAPLTVVIEDVDAMGDHVFMLTELTESEGSLSMTGWVSHDIFGTSIQFSFTGTEVDVYYYGDGEVSGTFEGFDGSYVIAYSGAMVVDLEEYVYTPDGAPPGVTEVAYVFQLRTVLESSWERQWPFPVTTGTAVLTLETNGELGRAYPGDGGHGPLLVNLEGVEVEGSHAFVLPQIEWTAGGLTLSGSIHHVVYGTNLQFTFNGRRSTGTEERDGRPADAKRSLALLQNVPNPFNPATTIRFEVLRRQRVRLEIFDLAGRRVRTLLDEPVDVGTRAVFWDGCDDEARSVGSGVYVYRVRGDDTVDRRTLVLLR